MIGTSLVDDSGLMFGSSEAGMKPSASGNGLTTKVNLTRRCLLTARDQDHRQDNWD